MKKTLSEVLTEVKVSKLSELNEESLLKLQKKPLASMIISLVNVFEMNLSICKSAAERIDELKSEQIELQKNLIAIQNHQIESVKATVKSEMNNGLKSWSDVVKKNTSQVQSNLLTTTKKTVKQVMEKVNEEERKSANLMIYGLPEVENEEIAIAVDEMFMSMNLSTPKVTFDCYRVGKKQEGKTRPIRLECQNRGDVDFALVHSRRLKNSARHSRVYLGPDRSKEQRLEHSLLVKQMKELIKKDATKHYYIRNNRVLSADRDKP